MEAMAEETGEVIREEGEEEEAADRTVEDEEGSRATEEDTREIEDMVVDAEEAGEGTTTEYTTGGTIAETLTVETTDL